MSVVKDMKSFATGAVVANNNQNQHTSWCCRPWAPSASPSLHIRAVQYLTDHVLFFPAITRSALVYIGCAVRCVNRQIAAPYLTSAHCRFRPCRSCHSRHTDASALAALVGGAPCGTSWVKTSHSASRASLIFPQAARGRATDASLRRWRRGMRREAATS